MNASVTKQSPLRVLYICSSQFSGSTLTSFLLNAHADIATIGHTMGWTYGKNEDFRCSCGDKISDCILFTKVRNAFAGNGLRFDPRNFGTEFRLAKPARLNQLLLEALPLLHVTAIEKFRDSAVSITPGLRSRLRRQQLANYVLMKTVLEHYGAKVYLDNSHSPYRLRTLARNPRFELYPIHLIRDPRGVSLSLVRNSGMAVSDAVDAWISHQTTILRIAGDVRPPLRLSYERLCTDTDAELARLHDYCGLEPRAFSGDFKEQEHHILGNRMRLSAGSIRLDEKWRRELERADQELIESRLRRFDSVHPESSLSPIIRSYLNDP